MPQGRGAGAGSSGRSYFERNDSGMEGLSRLRGHHFGRSQVAGICLLSSEEREQSCLGVLTSLMLTGLGAPAGVVHEEHGVEVLPEYQP